MSWVPPRTDNLSFETFWTKERIGDHSKENVREIAVRLGDKVGLVGSMMGTPSILRKVELLLSAALTEEQASRLWEHGNEFEAILEELRSRKS